MEIVVDFLVTLSSYTRPYLHEIGLSMTATLLVIFGTDITNFVKSQIGSLKYFMRLTLFIIFCAIGFTVLTSYLMPFIVGMLAQIDDLWLFLVVIATYYFIGYLAQRKGLI